MKFLTVIDSAKTKALLLAAMTIATSLVGNAAPSQANQANSIIGFPGRADIVTFKGSSQSFSIGCRELRRVWSLPTQIVSDIEYQKLYKVAVPLAGTFICSPSRNKAYTSPSFPPGYAVLEMPGKTVYEADRDTFYIANYNAILKAIGVTPTTLSAREGQDLINANPRLKTNTVIEPDYSPFAPPFDPPVLPPVANKSMTVTATNRGAYVATYSMNYNINGNLKTVSSGNVAVSNRFTFSIPGDATNIKFKAEAYGLGSKGTIFERTISNTLNNLCFTTRGTLFKAPTDDSCN